MTVVETVLALVIALGVIASAIEASRLAINRSALARLDIEAQLDAEALAVRAGNDLALAPGRTEGNDGNGVAWAIDMVPATGPQDAFQAYRVVSDVRISRAGLTAHGRVATLKIQWPRR